MNANMPKSARGTWQVSDEKCPRCEGNFRELVVKDCREDDGIEREYIDAEYCIYCGTLTEFA